MPKAYRITKKKGEDTFGIRYDVSLQTSALVPPLDCPSCGETRRWGFSYPTLNLASLAEDIVRHLHLGDTDTLKTITLDDYKALEAKLAPVLGPKRPLSPLTRLGALRGSAEGKFSDFVWSLGEAIPLVRQSVYNAMRAAGFTLTAASTELTYRRERQDPLIGFEVLPTARAHPSEVKQACSTCGFATSILSDNVKLDAASFDASIPLQCVLECPRIVLVNEALAQFIRKKGLSDVELRPMQFESSRITPSDG